MEISRFIVKEKLDAETFRMLRAIYGGERKGTSDQHRLKRNKKKKKDKFNNFQTGLYKHIQTVLM